MDHVNSTDQQIGLPNIPGNIPSTIGPYCDKSGSTSQWSRIHSAQISNNSMTHHSYALPSTHTERYTLPSMTTVSQMDIISVPHSTNSHLRPQYQPTGVAGGTIKPSAMVPPASYCVGQVYNPWLINQDRIGRPSVLPGPSVYYPGKHGSTCVRPPQQHLTMGNPWAMLMTQATRLSSINNSMHLAPGQYLYSAAGGLPNYPSVAPRFPSAMYPAHSHAAGYQLQAIGMEVNTAHLGLTTTGATKRAMPAPTVQKLRSITKHKVKHKPFPVDIRGVNVSPVQIGLECVEVEVVSSTNATASVEQAAQYSLHEDLTPQTSPLTCNANTPSRECTLSFATSSVITW